MRSARIVVLTGGVLAVCLSYALPPLRAASPGTIARLQTAEPNLRQPPNAPTQSPVVTVPGTTPAVSPSIPSQPAVAVTEVKSPAAPAHYADQAIWALMIALLIQYLKKAPWFAWVKPESTARLKAQFGFVAAVLTAAGIHFAVSGSVLDGGGASITISGLSLNAFKDIAWQWASQQAWYLALINNRTA